MLAALGTAVQGLTAKENICFSEEGSIGSQGSPAFPCHPHWQVVVSQVKWKSKVLGFVSSAA